ncbi:SHOCT domain-containing protein [Ammoniphilus sp. 3BR4]|uniref:SHOCT domain-containing protein n=1 Tax=Ammoniphilus sp. 3BR4 TaxID=3158265 RepID=UPI003465A726
MMGYMNGMGLGGFGMMFWMFLQWGLLLTGIYFLIRWISGGKAKSEDHALDILRERFAKGEISEEEFNHKKAILRA